MRRMLIRTLAAGILMCLPASHCQAEPGTTNLIANLHGRVNIGLNGTWRAIVDPYEVGLGSRFYENRKPKDKSDLVEYDFDHAWTLIPAQAFVAQMVSSLVEFPPSQVPASFTIGQVLAKLQAGIGST